MAQRIDVSLDELYQLRGRIDRQELEAGDWPLVGGLVSKLIGRTEARQKRMLAKLGTRLTERLGHFTKDVDAAVPGLGQGNLHDLLGD